jgi:hypothetical protein
MRFAARKFADQIYEAWQDFNMSDVPPPLEESSDERQVFMPLFPVPMESGGDISSQDGARAPRAS